MRRCKHDIVIEMLSTLSWAWVRKNDLFKMLRINNNYGNELLYKLLENNLIYSANPRKHGAKYSITDKGEQWLDCWKEITEIFDE